MELPALLIALIPIVAGIITPNFYLGTNHNAIETEKEVVMRDEAEVQEDKIREKAAAAEEAARAKVTGRNAAFA
jgi:hypothetical protein